MDALVTGAAFGAALTASGVYQPSVIVSQLTFENWHMIQAFLTATAASAVLVTALQNTGYLQAKPRGYSSVGLFSAYDGNIIGGLTLGAGMALAGSCPGTVFPQIALGIRSGYYAVGGALAGGIAWVTFLRPMIAKRPKPQSQLKTGVYEALGISHAATLAIFETAFASVVAGTVLYTSTGPEARISPVVGGLLIGAAQLLSLLLRKTLIGVSTCFEVVGDWVTWGFSSKGARPGVSSLVFSAGMVAGSWALGHWYPELISPVSLIVPPAQAFAGGVLMAVGARAAGGCTSGHGISGISLLSVSSLITIGAAFGFGAVISKFLY
ncbi:putative family protein [Phaeoacremonium minimum UCRPA7]|uniref:Putative family protein n=1 Tax=Phaeoacremonium minimum (strain UCR-PA7) TaxID=1286976 RepID=R8BI33_PHAM7|nr:putative family protein [Phaeoacremonium minimum UCRPA7]EON98902.1 putative family protein [Phaeoacremonium minimum UCRPA7]